MTYTPDITRYQQLTYGGATGPYDCTAWSAAILVDAHSQGAKKVTGRAIRLHTDEPVPDPKSPGLNLPQVDAAVLSMTSIDLDTRVQLRSLSRADVEWRIKDGRWASIQVLRSVLVSRGFLDGFRGGHDLTVHADGDVPVIGDPLVPHYVRASWDAIFDAAEALTGGRVYAQFTRDLTPDYKVVIQPAKPGALREFMRFSLNPLTGKIQSRSRHRTYGMTAHCTAPSWHGVAPGAGGQGAVLVQLTTGGRKGWWVNARYSQEIVP